MDVDAVHFWPQLLPILKTIAKATFVTFDLEMSGIFTGQRNKYNGLSDRLTLQQQYEETKAGAETYQVLQIGITCILEDRERSTYIARPYNFNVSPLFIDGDRLRINRDITFSTKNIQFLMDHSFNIGAIFTKGVPYLSREEEATARKIFMKSQDKSSQPPDIVVQPDDIDALEFYNMARKTISAFANQKPEQDFVNISGPAGSLNGFQRRLIYQLVRKEFPLYRTFSRRNGEFMQIEKIDPEREEKIGKAKLLSFEAALAKQTGLRFIFEALAGGKLNSLDPTWFCINERGEPALTDLEEKKREIDEIQKLLEKKTRVIVGHNLFIDLAFLYKVFVGVLPDDVHEFQRQIHSMFPNVIDTKYMFTHENGSMHSNIRLADIYDNLRFQTMPFIVLGEQHLSYGAPGKEHEAGYDSWMTAKVFVKLTSKLDAERKAVFGFESGEDDSKPKFSSRFSTGTRFDKLKVEGDDESPDDFFLGGVNGNDSNNQTQPKCEASLLDDPIPDGFKLVASKHAHLRPQLPHQASSGPLFRDVMGVTSDTNGSQSLFDRNGVPEQVPDSVQYKQWIPSIKSSFWKAYANKLRVNRIETGVCDLTS